MKIDEHISLCRVCAEDLRNTAKRFNNAQMKEDAKEWDELADMLEELQWYKEQDLIKRGDVIKLCTCDYDNSCIRIKFAENCENCYWHIIKSRDIKQIPKAEYGDNEDEERSNSL